MNVRGHEGVPGAVFANRASPFPKVDDFVDVALSGRRSAKAANPKDEAENSSLPRSNPTPVPIPKPPDPTPDERFHRCIMILASLLFQQ